MNSLKNKFLKWEQESGIYDIKEDNFPIWHIVRVSVFMAIMKEDFKFEQINRETKTLKNKISFFKKLVFLKNIVKFFLKMFKLINSDLLIISKSENRQLIDDLYVDKYFDQIKQENKKITILEFPDLLNENLHYKNCYNNNIIVYADIIYALEIINKKLNKKNINTDKIYLLLNQFISDNFDRKISIDIFNKNIKKLIERQINRKKIFLFILKFARPKALLLKSSYDPMSQFFLYYANSMNIKTIEMQHGHIYSNHPGYIKTIVSDVFIDKIYPQVLLIENLYYKKILQENGWKDNELIICGNIVLKKNVIDTIKLNTLQDKIKGYANVITIINQHTLSKEISLFFKDIEKIKDKFFIIKLHPRLIDDQRHYFKDLNNLKNVELILDQNTLEECFMLTDIVLGVYSTAIIDALKLDLQVTLLNLPGVDFLDDLVEKGIANKINNISELTIIKKNRDNILVNNKDSNQVNKAIYDILYRK